MGFSSPPPPAQVAPLPSAADAAAEAVPEPANIIRRAAVRRAGSTRNPFSRSPSQRPGVATSSSGGSLSPARTAMRQLIGGAV